MAVDPRTGRFIGSSIGLVFGVVFVLANTGELAPGPRLALRLAAVVVAVVLAVGTVRQLRRAGADEPVPGRGGFDRRYAAVVAAEVLALAVGLAVINGVLQAPRFAVTWVAFVVGVHFFGLARIWRLPQFTGLGAVVTALGVAGAVAGFLGAGPAVIGVISGVLSGVALFAWVGLALRHD
ncbi:hypothetical protein LWC33_33180 [Pseudonocardia sp. RS11V-5]|uniref:hypothetical protein n=1 Tax=Pseudonocardia terrae TaxID=2905831 RepID=UPI001E2DE44C|nr:hypothetical protein [Pseudonocardia terrae]MCE3556283.1 hypothetical protein [Pseudonocardia terrae]